MGHNCKIYSDFYDLEVMREPIVHEEAGKRTLLSGGSVMNGAGSARVCSGAASGVLGLCLFGDFSIPHSISTAGLQ